MKRQIIPLMLFASILALFSCQNQSKMIHFSLFNNYNRAINIKLQSSDLETLEFRLLSGEERRCEMKLNKQKKIHEFVARLWVNDEYMGDIEALKDYESLELYEPSQAKAGEYGKELGVRRSFGIKPKPWK